MSGIPRSERDPSTLPIDFKVLPYRDADGDVAHIAPDGTGWKQPVPDEEDAASLGISNP